MPDLAVEVVGAEAVSHAATPTMMFKLRIRNAIENEQVRSVILRAQIRIESTLRHYDRDTEARLVELFGEPQRWGETLRSVLWTHATAVVPAFTGTTTVDLPVSSTYDFEVASTKYFHALEDGEAPLLFLFSGTVFFEGEGGGLQTMQISWNVEAPFRLPVERWKEMMNACFPNSAWIRIRKDVFDRLCLYKGQRGLPTWEDTIEKLLQASEMEVER